MGLESFNIILYAEWDEHELDSAVAGMGGRVVGDQKDPDLRYWELWGPDYCVEIHAAALQNQASMISVRCALCCSSWGVRAMLGVARQISASNEQFDWLIPYGHLLVDVRAADTEQTLREVFLRRRNDLLSAFGLSEAPPIACRSGSECFAYLESLRGRPKGAQLPPEGRNGDAAGS